MDFFELWAVPESVWPQAVESYIANGGDVNMKHPVSGWSLLHVAAEYRSTETVRFLVSRGADINARDHQGMTALHWAVDADIDQPIQTMEQITMATVKTFVECGADVTIKDNLGHTPRDMAFLYGRTVSSLYDAIVNSRAST